MDKYLLKTFWINEKHKNIEPQNTNIHTKNLIIKLLKNKIKIGKKLQKRPLCVYTVEQR